MHAAKQQKPAAASGALEVPEPRAEPVDDVPGDETEILRKAGLDPESVFAQWGRDKALTEDQYAALKKAYGWSKSTTNLMATGAQAKAESRAMAYNTAAEKAAANHGGMDAVREFLQTEAPKHLNEDERSHFTKMLRDPKTVETAIISVKALVAARSGNVVTTKPISGDGPASYTNGAKDLKEWGSIQRAAAKGDRAALEAMQRTPQSSIEQWQREVGIKR